MVEWLEVELRFVANFSLHDVAGLGQALGNRLVRKVGQMRGRLLKLGPHLGELRLERLRPKAELSGMRDGGRALVRRRLRNLLGGAIVLGPQPLDFAKQLPVATVELDHSVEHVDSAAASISGFNRVEVVS